MNYLYAKLNKEVELAKYKGKNTETAKVTIDDKTNTISVDVNTAAAVSAYSKLPIQNKAVKQYVDNYVVANVDSEVSSNPLTNISIGGVKYSGLVGDTVDFDNHDIVIGDGAGGATPQKVYVLDGQLDDSMYQELLLSGTTSIESFANKEEIVQILSNQQLPVIRLSVVVDEATEYIVLPLATTTPTVAFSATAEDSYGEKWVYSATIVDSNLIITRTALSSGSADDLVVNIQYLNDQPVPLVMTITDVDGNEVGIEEFFRLAKLGYTASANVVMPDITTRVNLSFSSFGMMITGFETMYGTAEGLFSSLEDMTDVSSIEKGFQSVSINKIFVIPETKYQLIIGYQVAGLMDNPVYYGFDITPTA